MGIGEADKALWNRALWCLSRRDYGTKELRERLLRPHPKREPPSEADVEAALLRLTELGLLNDERRAERLTQALIRKGWGTRKIQMELRQRGLPEPETEPEEGDTQVIERLLRTKYAAKLQDERGRRLTFQALQRRGFSFADIKAAMAQAGMDDEDDVTYDEVEL